MAVYGMLLLLKFLTRKAQIYESFNQTVSHPDWYTRSRLHAFGCNGCWRDRH